MQGSHGEAYRRRCDGVGAGDIVGYLFKIEGTLKLFDK